MRTSPPPSERAALVGLIVRRSNRLDAEQSLNELRGLAEAAGATVVLKMIQERPTPDPATFIGKGKLDELASECTRFSADVVIFDNELTPAQLRQIEERVDRKVIDRTQLILDIFARRARTREGKWQVELAQLKYLLPRLVGSAAALSRLGGGIGTRGPGETKLETDRRRIRQRIHAISSEIDNIRRRRDHARGRRRKASVPLVALVGYTNAGKTTLFNLLTNESAEASNALFVTLDPLVRQVSLPDRRQLLVSDTVGFIDRLPHTLVAAFRATLEQVAEADLILHVIDAASPSRASHVEAVRKVLEEVGASDVARLDVFNKSDLLETGEADALRRAHPEVLFISALKGTGRQTVIDTVAALVELDTRRVHLEFDSTNADDRERIARVYRHARVVSHEDHDGRVAIEADVPRRVLDRVSPDPMTRAFRPILAAAVLAVCVSACGGKLPPAAPGAPHFPDFISPVLTPPDPRQAQLSTLHDRAWQLLQSGDIARAKREFESVLKRSPAYYPSDAALGYVELAEKNYPQALEHFDRVIQGRQNYVSALVGRGETLLGLTRDGEALASFETALRADPTLVDVGRRVEVLRARAAQDNVAAARKAAQAGRLDEAIHAYQEAIAASPDSAFLFRDMADIEEKQGSAAQALEHYRKSIELDPSDVSSRVHVAGMLDAAGDLDAAMAMYAEAYGLEPSADIKARMASLTDRLAYLKLPAEYRALGDQPSLTRGDLAALLGIRLEALMAAAPPQAALVTDVRAHWASQWIMSVARAGVMEAYDNHTFQPRTVVRRGDLAQAVSRVLKLIAARQPALLKQWQGRQAKMTDVGVSNLNYADASLAVSSDVLPLAEGGLFQLARPVSGAEAIDAVSRLERLYASTK